MRDWSPLEEGIHGHFLLASCDFFNVRVPFCPEVPRNFKPKQEMNLSKGKITTLLQGVGDDHKKDIGHLECSFPVVQEKDILGASPHPNIAIINTDCQLQQSARETPGDL